MRGFWTEADGLSKASQHDFRKTRRTAYRPVCDGGRGRDSCGSNHYKAEDVRPSVERILRAHRRECQNVDPDGFP